MDDEYDYEYEEIRDYYDASIEYEEDLRKDLTDKATLLENIRTEMQSCIENASQFKSFSEDFSLNTYEKYVAEASMIALKRAKNYITTLSYLYELYKNLHAKEEHQIREMIEQRKEYIQQLKEDEKDQGYTLSWDTTETQRVRDELKILERVLRKKTI